MSRSGIIRVKKTEEYFIGTNELANNSSLSWEARGVLFYLLSKPDDWSTVNTDLINRGPAGRDKIFRILQELKVHGYMQRVRYRNNKGQFRWETLVFESPDMNLDFNQSGKSVDGAIDGKTVSGSAVNGKAIDVQSTESTNHDHEDDDIGKKPDSSSVVSKQILDLYESNMGAIAPIVGAEINGYAIKVAEVLGQEASINETLYEWFQFAIKQAAGENKLKWSYVKGILDNLLDEGSIAAHVQAWQDSRSKRGSRKKNNRNRRSLTVPINEIELSQLSRHELKPETALSEEEMTWQAIQQSLPFAPRIIDGHFSQAEVVGRENGTLTIAINKASLSWVEQRLRDRIDQAVERVHPGLKINFITKEEVLKMRLEVRNF